VRAPDWSPPARDADPHTLEVHLKPVLDGREIARVEVTLRFSEPPGDFAEHGPLVLAMRQRDAGESVTEAVEEVAARDADGPLALQARPAEGGEARVEWRSDRRPVGAVSVTYRVKAARTEGKKLAGVRAQAGGLQSTGGALLLLPETADTYRVRIAWDLAAAGEGARAITSIGAGAEADAKTSLERLRGAVLMAGPLGRLSIDTSALRFEGAWLGKPGIDPLDAVPWAARAHAEARAFFRDKDTAPFTLLMRAAPGTAWMDAERTDGLLLVAGEDLGWTPATRFAVGRAVVRRWIGGADHGLRLDGPEAASAWLARGLAAHYARAILLRAGLCTPEDVAEDLRVHAERFALGDDPAHAAEDRGMLYAADVDAAVRAKSGGKRSLDDLVLALLDRARAGHEGGGTAPLPASAWRDLVGSEIGPEAQARYDAVIVRGEAFTPRDDAFGPCFKAAKKKLAKAGARGGGVNATVWVRDPKVPAASCARAAQR
jgi:predicted metalloprotease with PDZ domain